jgi:uncharacterized protein (TIGR03437 family)
MSRLIFAFLCAVAACLLVAGALTSSAQSTTSFTPDPFVAQITHAPSGRDSNAGDMSGNGRFVVFESTGDVSTLKPTQTINTKSPDNLDGNREIFLYDYAQRRIFQITNTKSVAKPTATPSPTASPTATPSPAPLDFTNIQIEVSNLRPMISFQPGTNTYTIVFSSNAPVTPAFFDGVDPGAPANADFNQEIWIYQFTIAGAVNLADGADIPYEDLSGGPFTRITNTPASRAPSAGSTTAAPFFADDNRDASISDDGSVIAFVSTRDFVPGGNTDAGAIPNPEIFIVNRGNSTVTQVTNTKTTTNLFPVFNENPCLAGSGSAYTLAFTSTANFTGNNDDGGGNGNAEIFMATYNGTGITSGTLRQITKTKNNTTTQQSAVVFGYGRRLSHDGRWIAFESLNDDPKANASAASAFLVTFVYDNISDSFTQIGPRNFDVGHYPTVVVNSSGSFLLFSSAQNLKTDGTIPTTATDGLNPAEVSQIFMTSLPATSTGPFTRLTKITGTTVLSPVRSLPSDSFRRIAFSMGGAELGGGNGSGDFSTEVFYQLTPAVTTESTGTISMFTGASLIPVAVPVASGSPTPSPTTSPFTAPGLAAGEVALINSSVTLAPGAATTVNGSESRFAPSLPVELNGVSVAINGAAAGLYSVDATAIKFVMPQGLIPNTGSESYNVVINIRDTATTNRVIRGRIIVVAAQPDIETTSNGPNGRAVICNVTVATSGCIIEPFNVTTPDASGSPVPTKLEVHLTGVRGTAASSINVVIGTTSIVASQNIVADLPGFDQVIITLPSTVDRGDNLPVVVTVGTATSRPTPALPPLVKINP